MATSLNKPNLTTLTAGRTFPDVTRLDWLQALITDYEEHLPGVDPDAEATMLSEVRGLLADLRTGSEAGRTLGKIRTPRKMLTATANIAKARAARKPPAPCTCGRDPHAADCPAYRRAAIAKYRAGLIRRDIANR